MIEYNEFTEQMRKTAKGLVPFRDSLLAIDKAYAASLVDRTIKDLERNVKRREDDAPAEVTDDKQCPEFWLGSRCKHRANHDGLHVNDVCGAWIGK